jgi:hypothetical protein
MDTDSLLVSYEDYKVLLEDPDLEPYLHKKPWSQAEFGDFEDEFWDEFGTEAIKTVFNPGDMNEWKQNATETQIDQCYGWIHENRVSTVYGIRPKVYGVYGPKEPVKTKYKGMSKNAKLVPEKLDISTADLFKCFTNKLCEDGNPLHNDAPLLEPVSQNYKFKQCIYESIVAGETLRTLNSQIVKEIGYNQKFCQLRQVYLTKNLSMK